LETPTGSHHVRLSPHNPVPTLVSAVLSLFSGAALVIAIGLRANLGIVFVSLTVLVAAAGGLVWSTSTPANKANLKSKYTFGVLAGLLGTLAYDSSRWCLVKLIGWTFNPFGALPVFGRLFLGNGYPATIVIAVGICYHVLNGVLFAIAYCLVAFGKPWYWGIFWALALEGAMFTLYPGWLDLRAVMKEFTVVSVTGHIVYGSVIGAVCQSPFRISTRFKLI